MNKEITNETFLKSWFRDQVLHPHETLHTLKEVVAVLDECNCRLLSTSINKFKKIKGYGMLFEEEKKFAQISKRKLRKGVYFPGFFCVLVERI